MKWLELHIDTSPVGLEPVETLLSALGIDGVIIDDQTEDAEILRFCNGKCSEIDVISGENVCNGDDRSLPVLHKNR